MVLTTRFPQGGHSQESQCSGPQELHAVGELCASETEVCWVSLAMFSTTKNVIQVLRKCKTWYQNGLTSQITRVKEVFRKLLFHPLSHGVWVKHSIHRYSKNINWIGKRFHNYLKGGLFYIHCVLDTQVNKHPHAFPLQKKQEPPLFLENTNCFIISLLHFKRCASSWPLIFGWSSSFSMKQC